MSAPCLSCPSNCSMCAFDHSVKASVHTPIEVIKSENYGCVKKAAIYQENDKLFMKTSRGFYPLKKTKNKNILEAQKRTRLAVLHVA